MQKNAKNATFFYKERNNAKNAAFFYKEGKRTPRSFIKNAKERKNVGFFWKEPMPNPAFFSLRYGVRKVAIVAKSGVEWRKVMTSCVNRVCTPPPPPNKCEKWFYICSDLALNCASFSSHHSTVSRNIILQTFNKYISFLQHNYFILYILFIKLFLV